MKKRQSKETLVEDCEAIDCSVYVPTHQYAPSNLTADNDCDVRGKHIEIVASASTAIDVEIDKCRKFEPMEEDKAWIINRRTTSLIWYRNWTNAGIALCIFYNACIIMLLVMGYQQFISKKSK